MAGLLDGWGDFIKTPEGQGLLSAAFGGLAGARKGQPINSIGRAGLAGLSGYAVAQDQQAQMADRSAIQRYRAAQTSALTQKQQESARVQSAIANFGKQGMGMGATGMVNDALPPDLRIGAMPSIQPPATLDYTSLIQQGVPVETVKALAESRNFGLNKVARTQDIEGPGGAKLIQGYDDYGRPVGQGVNGYVAPVSVNRGDRTTFVKPTAGVSLPMNMTFADKNAAANLNLSRQRLAFDQGGGVDGGGASQAAMIKQFGKPSAGYRWKADGSQEFIPGGPADQKAQMQKSGEGTVGSVVADLRDKYDVLNKEGGIVSTQKGVMENLGARAGTTGVGQFVSGAVGSKTQSAREAIAMTRPLLLQSIMKATGMSAKQMDSNAELKLYLATATDPTLGLEANKEALDRIEKLYGGGGGGGLQSGATGSFDAPKTAGKAFDAKPPAQQFKGKTMTGPDGKRYQSDGMMWKAVP